MYLNFFICTTVGKYQSPDKNQKSIFLLQNSFFILHVPIHTCICTTTCFRFGCNFCKLCTSLTHPPILFTYSTCRVHVCAFFPPMASSTSGYDPPTLPVLSVGILRPSDGPPISSRSGPSAHPPGGVCGGFACTRERE